MSDKLAFYVCSPKGFGSRIIQRRSGGDSRTIFDGFLNAQAYLCRDYAEFQHIMERQGKRENFYAAVAIVSPDGKRRFPGPSDVVQTLSAAPELPACRPGGVVSVSEAGAAELLPRIREAIKDKKARIGELSKVLNLSTDAIRTAVSAPGSGIDVKGPCCWLSLTPVAAA